MASTQKGNQSVSITKTVLDRWQPPEQGQRFLRDTRLPGFGARITAKGVVSFIVEKRIEGRVKRETLGRYGVLTVQQARKAAQAFLGEVATGGNPIARRENERMRATTLGDAFEAFKRVRKNLKARSLYDYERQMMVGLGDWQKVRLVDITRQRVLARHAELGAEHGHYYANACMRTLSSVMGFALAHYQDAFGNPLLLHNPVLVLTQTRAWFKEKRRDRVLSEGDLARWYQAVEQLRDAPTRSAGTIADLLLFLLFTGLRLNEAVGLTWDRVHEGNRTIRIEDTKNGDPLTLPISRFAAELLDRRRRLAVNGYVFPGTGPTGRLKEHRKGMAKVVTTSGVEFTAHDLRRTFLTIGTRLRIGRDLLKRLVNHRVTDVTGGYIVLDLEDLREPAESIGRYLERTMGVTTSDVVVPLHAAAS